jgi:dienelactone hydrolase
MSGRWLPLVATLLLLGLAVDARAQESVIELAVATRDSRGHPVEGRIPVTVYKPPGDGPFPAVIVSHGRPGLNSERQRMGRQRLASAAMTLLGQRMVVLVPTRLGYGGGSAHDPEYFVSCAQPHYAQAFAAGADQVAQTVQLARSLPYVDGQRIFLVGFSVGGGITATAAARGLPGVRAAVNFSGAHGGRLGAEPCRSDLLKAHFASLGAAHATTVPQLWIYVENDELVPPATAMQWFDAFSAAGGPGEFRMMPPRYRAHYWFIHEPGEWRDAVMEFFARHGL